ncbi:MAG: rane-flanked domain [Akkermansiaceae bacterium]|nr:rane-flanked domain [Akkermansiaceae bacterium]
MNVSEEVLWKGSPSQVLNLGKYLITLILIAGFVAGGFFFPPVWFGAILPVLWMIWEYLKVRCHVYELTSERLRSYRGVLNQKMDDVELYRVKDTSIERPFWYRMSGLSTLMIETSDRVQPHIEIKAVRGGMELREQIRHQVERLRDSKRVREVDFDEGSSGHDGGDIGGLDGLHDGGN